MKTFLIFMSAFLVGAAITVAIVFGFSTSSRPAKINESFTPWSLVATHTEGTVTKELWKYHDPETGAWIYTDGQSIVVYPGKK